MKSENMFKKDLSRFFQSSLNEYLADNIPFKVFRIHIHILGFCYYLYNIKKIKSIDKLISHVFRNQLSFYEQKLLTIKTICGFFDHYYEKLVNAHFSLYGMMSYLCKNIEIENVEWLDDQKKYQKGCILVSGHFGAVEYLPLFLTAKGYRPTMIVSYKTKQLRDVLTFKSNRVGLELLDVNCDKVVANSLRALEEGRILITLCDEFKKWHGSKDEYISVLGRIIPKDKTLDMLHRLTNLPACLGLVMRAKSKYVLRIVPLLDDNREHSLSSLAWKRLEQFILTYPEQWYQWQEFEQDLGLYLNRFNQCRKNKNYFPKFPLF
jgi:Kdo2-lipid IVA lauroyltransferase/acyltransferase